MALTLLTSAKLSQMDEIISRKYFAEEVKPLLSPQIVDRHHPFPFLRNQRKICVFLSHHQKRRRTLWHRADWSFAGLFCCQYERTHKSVFYQ